MVHLRGECISDKALIPPAMAQPQHTGDLSIPPLTLRQWLQVFPVLLTIPLVIATGVFRENKGRSWSHAANIAAMRYLLGQKWDIYTFRSVIGTTTSQVYEKWAREEKQQTLTDNLPEGAKLHWIGPRRDASQDRVFLFICGGGFSLPARPDHFQFLRGLQKDVSASLGDVGVALLEHSLTPESPVPMQLRQANAALTHLLNKGIPPANIVIGGDSSGGNLVLQLASHILHPLPSIPAPPALARPLAGALLISPWCSYSADAPSYTRNDVKDVISARGFAFVMGLVKEGLAPELKHYAEPLSAPSTWWKGLDGVYGRILITASEYECPLDHVIEMSTTISQHVRDTTTVVERGAVHGEVMIKFAAGEGGSGKDYAAMIGFLSRSFQGGS